MHITLNGRPREIENPMSVQSLLISLSLDQRKIAVECNLEIVPRHLWARQILDEGDCIEIIDFVGGG